MTKFFTFDTVQAGLVLLLLLVLGDVLSKKAGSRVPPALFAGLLTMLIGWTGILPANLLELAGLDRLTTLATGIILVGLGSSMSVRTFIDNWRVTVLAIATYFCQIAVLLGVVGSIFGTNLALGALPGGSMVVMIVRQRAAELGHDATIVLSVLFFPTQGLVACILAGHYAKKASQRLLEDRKNGIAAATLTEVPPAKEDRFFSRSNYGTLAKCFLISWVASRLGMIIGINQYVICMIFGVASAAVGFLDKETVSRTGSNTFLYFILMSTIMAGYLKATPELFAQMLVPLAVILGLEAMVIIFLSPLIGRLLGFDRIMSITLGSNIMMGFPLNMMVSTGIADSLTDDPEEREFLRGQIATRMVIAGLSTTTTTSVLMAGILVNLMH